MNAIASFRLCTLSDDELLEKIDEQTDSMFKNQKVPNRHIPAQPNEDYDLLVGELLLRFKNYGMTERNFTREQEKTEMYLGDKLIAWVEKWEELNSKKEKWEKKSQVYCHIHRVNSKWKFLNLGECNDGGKFTSVNQAINQAKSLIDCCNKNGW